VVNCANDAVNKGFVQLTIGSETYKSVVTNGNFGITFTRCVNSSSAVAALIVYDSVKSQSGAPQTINILFGSAQNIGQIKVCADSTLPPVAGFTYLVGNTSVPVTVTFNNTSTNATSWLWIFGDGTSSSVENPIHTYTIFGDISVSLTATGPAGSNTINKIIHISGTPDDSYINLTMKGTTYTWVYPDIIAEHVDSSGGTFNSTQIQGTSGNWINFYILNDNALPGNYNITLSTIINGRSYPNNNATTTVTEYGLVGGNIIGTSSGQLKELDSTTLIPFTLAYKVKRNK
jgi:PKD repeat protein